MSWPSQPDAARGRLDQAQHRAADGGLAAAALADQAERLARADREADAVHRVDLADGAAAAGPCAPGSASSGPRPRAAARRHAACSPASSRSACQQADQWRGAICSPGAAADRSGSVASASAQRGAKAQPGGRSFSAGTMPGISASRVARRRLASSSQLRDRAEQAARIGVQRRGRTASATAASSTLRPAYMTMTRCAVSATTPRSWVISTTAVPSRAAGRGSGPGSAPGSSRRAPWSARPRSAPCGLQASAMAIIARCRMPPESWCGYSRARRSGSGMLAPAAASRPPSRAPPLATGPGAAAAPRSIWSPMVSTGFSAVIGSWKIIAISLPRTLRIASSSSCSRSWPSQLDAPPTMRPGGLGIRPHQRQRGDGLAAAAFADDGQRLARRDSANDTWSTARTRPRRV